MAFWTYILQSTRTGGYCCGYADDLERQLLGPAAPPPGLWKLVWSESHETRREAKARERQIRSLGVRRFLGITPNRTTTPQAR